MKKVTDLSYPFCNVSIFEWNNKYLIKFETNQLEQTYKISKLDVGDVEDLKKIMDDSFLDEVKENFIKLSLIFNNVV